MEDNKVLIQKGALSEQRRFEITDRIISVSMKGIKKGSAYSIDCLALNPRSKTKLSISRGWLIAALGMGVMVILANTLLPSLGPQLQPVSFPVALGSTILGIIFTGLCIMSSHIEKVYYSARSNFPLIKLILRNPDKASYKKFVDQLDMLIENSSEQLNLSDAQRNAGELRMMRRLMEDRIIDARQYETIKSSLLSATA